MKVEQDARFREQRAKYTLRWTCEDCALFAPDAGCALGYPTHRLRASRYEDPSADLLFCKDFELV